MRISFGMLVTFVVVFGALYGLAKVLQSVLRNTVLPRTRMDSGGKNAVLAGVGYIGFFLATIAAISSTGIDLTSLAVVAGALSVGIGFGLQNIVSNFVSGIILLVERPIKEGDWIEVGGQIGLRARHLGALDRDRDLRPGERDPAELGPRGRHRAEPHAHRHVGAADGAGRRELRVRPPARRARSCSTIAEDHPMVLLDPAARVLFMGFGADSLNFEIRCWLRDVNFSLSARSDMNFEIFERFKAERDLDPFPQRDVRIRNVEEFGAALRPPAGRSGRRRWTRRPRIRAGRTAAHGNLTSPAGLAIRPLSAGPDACGGAML